MGIFFPENTAEIHRESANLSISRLESSRDPLFAARLKICPHMRASMHRGGSTEAD
jgi:hypothetical protein